MMMTRRDFETLLLTLESTPALLVRAAAALQPAQTRLRPEGGGFSFIETVWHLADLEREGYGVRIRRMLCEENPALPNFDGDRIASERAYQDRAVAIGLALFERARALNLQNLRALSAEDWERAGAQEGVGRVTLSDVAHRMAEHDRSHGAEIAGLLALARGQKPEAAPCPTSAVA